MGKICSPNCPNNALAQLFDKYCSDKGTFWQSKHHYGSAYHSLFEQWRNRPIKLLEIGIGEDTAPSIATWLDYFPQGHIIAVDIKNGEDFRRRAAPGGQTERLAQRQAPFGCIYDPNMWKNPRVELHLDVNASDESHLLQVPLPNQLDIIIDDGSHKFNDQEATLNVLWDRVAPGGFYVIEDVLVGALPWDPSHAALVPTQNKNCSGECFFPQRPMEHPLLYDKFELLKTLRSGVDLQSTTKQILYDNDWFWTITGVHKGGGLDCSLVVRRKQTVANLDTDPPHPAADSFPWKTHVAWAMVWGYTFNQLRKRSGNGYRRVPTG